MYYITNDFTTPRHTPSDYNKWWCDMINIKIKYVKHLHYSDRKSIEIIEGKRPYYEINISLHIENDEVLKMESKNPVNISKVTEANLDDFKITDDKLRNNG